MTTTTEVTESEVLEMFESLSNWGRWGADDKLGTLNLITPEVTKAAAALVRHGRPVSLARTITPKYGPDNPNPPLHFMLASGEGAPDQGHGVSADWYGMACHGHSMTHLDSLGHLFWNGKMYNGRPASRVDQATGAKDGSIEDAGGGVVTRGVLLDLPRTLGIPYLEAGHRITPRELELAEAMTGVRVSSGDAALIRTGRDVNRAQRGPHLPEQHGCPGLSASCLPWIRERGIAVLGSDVAHDAMPSLYRRVAGPIHSVGIVGMGLWLLDNAYLDALAAAAAEASQWDFLFVLGPLKLKRGTGSPVNPLAVI
jgi:kynurenine formamidase